MEHNRFFTISYTSDIHGYYSNLDYASGKEQSSGLCNCAGLFTRNGNALIIDGGDTIQGSPFTYYYNKICKEGDYLPARVMNDAGYQFVTLGNHDFNYGIRTIERYLSQLNAVCLCANVEGIRGVKKTAVATLENGLRVGLTGVTSHYVALWEPPENLEGVTITDAFEAAAAAFSELKKQGVDCTVCIYHGGFERDVETGELLSDSDENQGYRMCKELGFDILLSGHQHQKIESAVLFGTQTCQPPDKARGFLSLEVEIPHAADRKLSVRSRFVPAADKRSNRIWRVIERPEINASQWLDNPVGRLVRDLEAKTPIERAENGSLIANFFNQVQLFFSNADISATALDKQVKGFTKDVSIRSVVSNYVFSNTLKTILVDRSVLKRALERCGEYFERREDGTITVSDAFLRPIEQHFNFDFFYGIEAVIDTRRPTGSRVISIRYKGEELADGEKLKLCLNSYRATGAGGYPFYAQCELVCEQQKEIAEMIMDYVSSYKEIVVDQKKWLTVLS